MTNLASTRDAARGAAPRPLTALSALLLATAALAAGCMPPSTASVYMVESASYGKGLLVVAPSAACSTAVKGPKGEPVNLDCSAQYIIRCDNDIPREQPFCALVREIGPDRESAYPASKR